MRVSQSNLNHHGTGSNKSSNYSIYSPQNDTSKRKQTSMTNRNFTTMTSPARESSMRATPSETKLPRKHAVPSYN